MRIAVTGGAVGRTLALEVVAATERLAGSVLQAGSESCEVDPCHQTLMMQMRCFEDVEEMHVVVVAAAVVVVAVVAVVVVVAAAVVVVVVVVAAAAVAVAFDFE